MPDLSKIYLYRMTHVDNVEHILKYGLTHKESPNASPNYKSIGDVSLITTRNSFILPNGKLLSQYIPFYFGTRTPMLFVIQKGFNSVQSVPSQDIIYCITSVAMIQSLANSFIFTDGHAANGFTSFFERDRVQEIDQLIDLKAVRAQFWKDENDLDLKRRKEAEFLVLGDIPLSAVLGFAVYNNDMKTVIERMPGALKMPVIVKPNYYF